MRYPRLSFEHVPYPNLIDLPSASILLDQVIYLRPNANDIVAQFRAIAPEPALQVQSAGPTRLALQVNNIASNAILEVTGTPRVSINESIEGINRSLEINFTGEQAVHLKWKLPEQEGLQFAIIGDTGAGLELEWVLQRVNQLGAQFLLHLGDFNYSEGEYDRAIELFGSAPLPCYVSIGNHDFNASGLIYRKFLDQIGPMNHSFVFAGTRFVNLDSAADFFPASSGRRGRLFHQLAQDQTTYSDHAFFTHRGFKDPRTGKDHVIGGIGEIDWLHTQIQQLGGDAILTGHVHRSAELDYNGIHQWTIGEGMGYQDIIHRQLMSKLLMGQVEVGKKISYQWQPLNLPWGAHLSPTHEIKLKLEQPPATLEWYRQILKSG